MVELHAPVPTIDLTPYTPVKTTEAGSFRRLVVASVCAGSALLPVSSADQAMAVESRQNTIQPTVIDLPPQGMDICPHVTDEALAAVDKMLAQPEDPGAFNEQKWRAEPVASYSGGLMSATPLTRRQEKHQQWDVKAAMARQTDQIMYDPATYTDTLIAPLKNPFLPPLPFSAYTDAAQAFGERYGITIRLAGGNDTRLINEGFLPHSTNNEGDAARKGIIDTIDHIGGLTKEYVELTGVKEVILYDEHDAHWAGFALYDRRAIALPLGNEWISEETVDHEFGHHQAYNTCGGAFEDPQFDAPGHAKFSAADSIAASQEIFDRRSDALNARNYDVVCEANEELNAIDQHVGAFTAYGKTDRGENKADMISMLGTQSLYQNAFRHGAPPALRERARIMLGRLYMTSKNIASYFIRLMPRQPITNYIDEACRTGDFSEYEHSSNNGMK